jgi:hypothetical protein
LNQTIKELATKAGIGFIEPTGFMSAMAKEAQERNLEKFAQLIVQECIDVCGSDFGTELIKQHFGIGENNGKGI